jgi:hypothetical protein
MRTVTWRDAVHADLPRILELWAEQEHRFSGTGVGVDRPTIFSPKGDTGNPVYPYQFPIVRVRVAEEDGIITGFKYQEAILETCVVTSSAAVMKTIGAELTVDAHWAKEGGFRSGWGLIPKKFINAFAHFLKRYPHIRPWRSLTPVGIDFSELGD